MPVSAFWTSSRLVLLSAAFITAFANSTLFAKLLEWAQKSSTPAIYIISVIFVQFLALVLFFAIFTAHRAYRSVLAFLLLVTALSAYFTDSYGVVIDRHMLINALETNRSEAMALFSWRLLTYLALLFVLPSFFLYRVQVRPQTAGRRLGSHMALAGCALALILGIALSMGSFWSSFLREQKPIRYYSTPLASLNAVIQVVKKGYFSAPKPLVKIAEDAHIAPSAKGQRKLVVIVVGETARADRFSINGYPRETTPLMRQENAISFSNVSSCGTSTAISVPCMFALNGRSTFDLAKAKYTENLLDIAKRVGIHVLWRNNNSGSKGVADRVLYQDFLSSKTNPVCDPECRDIGMLDGLGQYIDSHKTGDILIVLHQMGSHGPAYHERVPDAFKKFQPTCQTSQLDRCTPEQINNSYDNTILYTDYFLSQVVALLKRYDAQFKTAMLYASDHGESLGEGGIYLHGMPYMLAPKAQTHVPMILWLGQRHTDLNTQRLQERRDMALSHDHIFHTLLGMFAINSKVYVPELDVLRLSTQP